MEFLITQLENVTIISPVGSIDALTAEECARSFNELMSQGKLCLVADLSQVDFMSSAGLRLLLQFAKTTRQQGGDVRLAGASPEVGKILLISGLTTILKVFSSVDQAVGSYAG